MKQLFIGRDVMKKYIISLFISAGLSASAFFSNGAERPSSSGPLRFIPVPTDILPTNSVRILFCDSDGYIWIPTYSGLVRYDGYESVTYGLNGADNPPFNCYLNVVTESADKRIWIASEKGVFTLDKITGEINFAGPDLAVPLNAADILCYNGTDVWVGGDQGLFHCQASDGVFREIKCDGESIIGVSALLEDSEGYLWIAACEHGLFRYDIRTSTVISYDDPLLYYSTTVFKDSAGRLWIGTWGKGLMCIEDPYTRNSLSYTRYCHTDNSTSLLDDIVYDIDQDVNGRLWVASRSGLSIMDDDGQGSFTNYGPGNSLSDLPFNEVSSILKTRDGKMWLSMFCGGVCRVESPEETCSVDRLESLQRDLKTSSVRSMYNAGGNRIWLGVIGYGMVLYDMETGGFLTYDRYPAFNDFPYTSAVDVITKRRTTGELCFGTYSKGIWLLDPVEDKARRVLSANCPEFASCGITAISEDQGGSLWIGTRSGLYIMSPQDSVRRFTEGGEMLQDVKITDVKVDRSGNVWVATNYKGVLRIVPSTGEIRRWSVGENEDVDNIACLFVDSSGLVWAGSIWDGVSWYDTASDRFVAISSLSAIYDKGITNITQDRDSRIWVATANAAVSFIMNPGGKLSDIIYHSVDEIDPYLSFNDRTILSFPDGSVKIGMSKGIVTYPPENMSKYERTAGHLCFTDFSIDNVSLREMPQKRRRRVSAQDVNYSESVVVRHGDKSFSIVFSLLNYAGRTGNIYLYRLEGYDNRDIIAADGRHSAEYHGIPPGKYLFRVRAMAAGGPDVSNERVLRVIVRHSPLLSWWAILLYISAASSVVFAFIRYMKERIRSREEVRISKIERQKAEELNHLKLQFYTNVTHELMTPLSIIMASIDSLVKGEDVDRIAKVLSTNATRLMRLIQQVLEFRKVESGNLKLSVSEGNITCLVSRCVEAFSPLVSGKKQHLSFNSNPDEIQGWFDSDKLDKIVYNLLSNASKYTPEEGSISVSLSISEGGMLTLDVANTGDLMSEKTIRGLFKRFYDGDYRKHNTIGTGIGLSLVKDLVTLHKGDIAVMSTPETGNLFRVTLPVYVSAFDEGEIDSSASRNPEPVCPMPAAASPDEVKRPEGLNEDYTILFIDDNEELCMLFSSMLSAHFKVLTANDGETALSILSEEPVGLVVSDIMMPGMDGIQLCRTIKERFEYCHIPVILLTAKNAEESQIEGYNSGADGYVSKPCNFSLLYSQIVNCLKRVERKGADFRRQLVLDVAKLEYTSMDKTFINRAIECVNEHFTDCDFDLPAFVSAMGTSKTVLTEKLKTLTGLTPAAFILNVRLTVACKYMTENKDSIRISDLAFSVGFNDPKYFSTCFKKKYGMTPKSYMDSLP